METARDMVYELVEIFTKIDNKQHSRAVHKLIGV